MQLAFKCFALVFCKDQRLEIQNQWQIHVRTNRHTKLSQAYFPHFNTHRASYASFSAYYHRPLSVILSLTQMGLCIHMEKCSADSFEHSWKYLQAQALPQLPTKEEPVSEPKFGLSPVLSLGHRICPCDPTGLPLHLLSPPLMCCAFAAACFHLSTISDIKIPLIFLTVF